MGLEARNCIRMKLNHLKVFVVSIHTSCLQLCLRAYHSLLQARSVQIISSWVTISCAFQTKSSLRWHCGTVECKTSVVA